MFHIGQRVVCIHEVGCPSANEFLNVPIKGSISRVRGFVSPDVGYERTPGMLLEELVNPPWEYKEGVFEPSFHPYHFRLVVAPKTDISAFTRILDNVCAEKSALSPLVYSTRAHRREERPCLHYMMVELIRRGG